MIHADDHADFTSCHFVITVPSVELIEHCIRHTHPNVLARSEWILIKSLKILTLEYSQIYLT